MTHDDQRPAGRPDSGHAQPGHRLPGGAPGPSRGGARRVPRPEESVPAAPEQTPTPPTGGPPAAAEGIGEAGPSTYGHQFGGRSFGESWRQGEFGQGQERYYGDQVPVPQSSWQDAPNAPSPNPPPRSPSSSGRRRTALLVAGAVGLVAVLGAGAYALMRGDDDGGGQQVAPSMSASAPSAGPSPSTSSSASAPGSTGTGLGTVAVPPLVPGWQVRTFDDEEGNRAAFDVPATTIPASGVNAEPQQLWSFLTGDAKVTLSDNDNKPLVTAVRAVRYRAGYCTKPKGKDADRGFIAYQLTGDRDPADAAPDVAAMWADAVALKDDGSKEKSTPVVSTQVAINGGRTQAIQSRTTVAVTRAQDPAYCTEPKSVEVVVQSFTTGDATATVVLVRDKGIPDQIDDKTLDQILASARPLS
ncbi:hypothetical protein [Luteipulveratus halotolerans]|uniref:DUF8017 domain-containing protein n=1 Tax=Luteipulveratus halotolerans TaxID=1631356 RepID=A0A0L6CF18_9MICO|nr:hypothetical protein [Luteipulveratus halotolerans]KNX36170.1 hypothetical protein VV01_01820 [Luteipulveratus halotolerans]